jgi:hypothetical protein
MSKIEIGIEVKVFEVRDNATRITALCFHGDPMHLREQTHWLMGCVGWHETPFTYMLLPGDDRIQYEPDRWGGRTLPVAHRHIQEHWVDLATGDVVDVRTILGETDKPAESDRLYEVSL